jgi:Flp pilus assembly protein TadB
MKFETEPILQFLFLYFSTSIVVVVGLKLNWGLWGFAVWAIVLFFVGIPLFCRIHANVIRQEEQERLAEELRDHLDIAEWDNYRPKEEENQE